MRHILFIMMALVISLPVIAEKKEKKKEEDKKAYEFTMIKEITSSAVKNQYRSGTCWSFAGTAFLETELLRIGKGEIDLAEMFSVRYIYEHKAAQTVRWHGNLNFGMGGNFHDVLWVYKTFGMMPESAYAGLNYGEEKHVHGEMDALLDSYIKTIINNPNRKISSAWTKGFNGILDAYLGVVPETFTADDASFSPKSYAVSLGLNMDDYVEITSFNHHPFYESFVLEIPDNWMLANFYNVQLEDLLSIVENALMNGYSVGWDADVSEKGFSWKNGVALIPDEEKPEIEGMESDKWLNIDEKEKEKKLYAFEKPVKEAVVDQKARQAQFDNYKTTDDHLMLLTGIATDQRGEKFFKVKNSWSELGSPYKGYFFVSTPYVQLKTVSILVHKNAIPASIKEKLGLK